MAKAGEETSEQATTSKTEESMSNILKISDESVATLSSSDSRRDEAGRLQQLRVDVANLDGRLSTWQKSMAVGSSGIMRDKLEQIKEEKGETEQMLEDLRGKLEEHKRLTKPKKRPPQPKFQRKTSGSGDEPSTPKLASESTNPADEAQDTKPNDSQDADIRKGSTSSSKPKKRPPKPRLRGSTDGSVKSTSADELPRIQSSSLSLADLSRGFLEDSAISGDTGAEDFAEKDLDTRSKASVQGTQSAESSEKDGQETDKEVEELEEKIKGLEQQKEEMEQTLVELLKSYEGKTTTLQKEKQRLSDDKDTTYTEMKTLLIEQHEEAERLRLRLSRLEKKRRTFLLVAKIVAAVLLIALVGGAVYVKFFVEDITDIVGSLNYVCAPVKPGTKITESNGVVTAPWWAPPYTKQLFFPLLCHGRRMIQLEIKRGTLWITEQPEGTVFAKKTAHKARIEPERIHLSDRGGGHQELDSPWAVPENKKTKTGKGYEPSKLW